ncbi:MULTISPECIES: hypothetical protein [Streptomyces]|uniref:hypothetical protein n=1 Tax=Streptomyces TaxID=1883 RepID=UPI000A3C6F1D|nr:MULTISPECIES: hypothetical protein [Streptomyces]MDX3581188.1 hypothetical protein [Streptomyces europaeiscabiei]MDX3619962.1 hypothetical protein [Streptomyces europaeiscabiei]
MTANGRAGQAERGDRPPPPATASYERWKDRDPCQDGHGHGDEQRDGAVSFMCTFTAFATWEWEEEA